MRVALVSHLFLDVYLKFGDIFIELKCYRHACDHRLISRPFRSHSFCTVSILSKNIRHELLRKRIIRNETTINELSHALIITNWIYIYIVTPLIMKNYTHTEYVYIDMCLSMRMCVYLSVLMYFLFRLHCWNEFL